MRRTIRKLEDRVSELESRPVAVGSGESDEEKALSLVSHLSSENSGGVVSILANHIFTENDLRNCSRTGKKTVKCIAEPRPPLCPQKLQTLERLVQKKTGMSRENFNKKIENRKKCCEGNVKISLYF